MRNICTVHSAEDFIGMRKAGQFTRQVLDYISPYVQAGVSTLELNNLCQAFMEAHGAQPAPLAVGFPKAICTSINHVVCHGIPTASHILKNGDIINIDISLLFEGWYGDSSRMWAIGDINPTAQKLMQVTYECLMRAIDIVKPGIRLGDIGHIIQTHAEKNNFSVVREFCGHGIGRKLHAPPDILHYGRPGEGLRLEEGWCFTIEPMINAGRAAVAVLKDGWTVITADHQLSAQYEHTLGVTATGCEIFTKI